MNETYIQILCHESSLTTTIVYGTFIMMRENNVIGKFMMIHRNIEKFITYQTWPRKSFKALQILFSTTIWMSGIFSWDFTIIFDTMIFNTEVQEIKWVTFLVDNIGSNWLCKWVWKWVIPRQEVKQKVSRTASLLGWWYFSNGWRVKWTCIRIR